MLRMPVVWSDACRLHAPESEIFVGGRIVEEGPAREIVRNGQHPYTRALLSVVPRRDPRDRHQQQILRGETPDAVGSPPAAASIRAAR